MFVSFIYLFLNAGAISMKWDVHAGVIEHLMASDFEESNFSRCFLIIWCCLRHQSVVCTTGCGPSGVI